MTLEKANPEVSLHVELEVLIKEFLRDLQQYFMTQMQKSKPSGQKGLDETELVTIQNQVQKQRDKIINGLCLNALEQYSQILSWCYETPADSDPFKDFKKAFLKSKHEFFFEKPLFERDEFKEAQKKQLRENFEAQKVILKERGLKVSDDIEKNAQALQRLEEQNNKLAAFPTDKLNALDNTSMQRVVAGFISKLREIGAKEQEDVIFTSYVGVDLPRPINLIDLRTDAWLAILEDEVTAYEEALREEPWYVRFFQWFSPTRRERLQVLEKYKTDVRSQMNLSLKYERALQWLSLPFRKPEKSRLYHDCVLPRKLATKQIEFEKMPFLKDEAQKDVDACIKDHTNLLNKSNKRLENQNAQLQSTIENRNVQQRCLNKHLKEASKIELSDSFGYILNNASNLKSSTAELQKLHGIQILKQGETQAKTGVMDVIDRLALPIKSKDEANLRNIIKIIQSKDQGRQQCEDIIRKVIYQVEHLDDEAEPVFNDLEHASRIINYLNATPEQIKVFEQTKANAVDLFKRNGQRDEEALCKLITNKILKEKPQMDMLLEWHKILQIRQQERIEENKDKTKKCHLMDEKQRAIYDNKIVPLRMRVKNIYEYGNGVALKKLLNDICGQALTDTKLSHDKMNLFEVLISLYGKEPEDMKDWLQNKKPALLKRVKAIEAENPKTSFSPSMSS